MAPIQPDTLIRRLVDIPCPSGKHTRSLVTFRNRTVAAMFCIPCEIAWTTPTSHPQIAAMKIEEFGRS